MSRRRAAGEGTVARRKDGRWAGAITVGYDADGKQQRRWAYGRTRQEAAEKLRALRQAQAEQTLPDASRLTVAEYLETWLAAQASRVRGGTLENWEGHVRKHIGPRIGRVVLNRLTPMHVQRMVGALASDPECGPKVAARARNTLVTALAHAVRLNAVARNVAQAVQAPRSPKREIDVWTPEEVRAFLERGRGDRYHAIGRLALMTGLRRGELLGLRWEDVSGPSLRVRQTVVQVRGKRHVGPPKSRAGERRIPLAADAVALLGEQRAYVAGQRERAGAGWLEHGLVFPTDRGTPIHPGNFAQRWKKYIQRLGLRYIRFHDTRHSYASLAIASGMDPVLLARLLGHARSSMTLDVYSHAWEARRAGAALTLEQLAGAPKLSAELSNAARGVN